MPFPTVSHATTNPLPPPVYAARITTHSNVIATIRRDSFAARAATFMPTVSSAKNLTSAQNAISTQALMLILILIPASHVYIPVRLVKKSLSVFSVLNHGWLSLILIEVIAKNVHQPSPAASNVNQSPTLAVLSIPLSAPNAKPVTTCRPIPLHLLNATHA